MQLPGELLVFIAIANGLVGLTFLYLPDRIRPFEAWLNAPLGNGGMATPWFGVQGKWFINGIVQSRQVIWDDWLVEHPRLFGMSLCALAIWLFSAA